MHRCLYCIALAGLLLVSPTANAGTQIAQHCRVKNRPPGRCGWCALETLARHLGLKAMFDLAERYPCTCSPRSLEAALLESGVHYRIQYPGIRNRSILHFAIEEEFALRSDCTRAPPPKNTAPCTAVSATILSPWSISLLIRCCLSIPMTPTAARGR